MGLPLNTICMDSHFRKVHKIHPYMKISKSFILLHNFRLFMRRNY